MKKQCGSKTSALFTEMNIAAITSNLQQLIKNVELN